MMLPSCMVRDVDYACMYSWCLQFIEVTRYVCMYVRTRMLLHNIDLHALIGSMLYTI